MDSFDDFEMKPLTEGLGFHKKALKLKDRANQSQIASESLQTEMPTPPPTKMIEANTPQVETREQAKKAIDDLLKSLNVEFEKPKPNMAARSENKKFETRKAMNVDFPLPEPTPLPDFIEERTPERSPIRPDRLRQELKATGTRRGAADSPVIKKLSPVSGSLPSACLDGFVVLAISMIFLMTLLFVAEVDLIRVAFNVKSDLATQGSLLLLFVALMQMYAIVARSFFGRTLGEWTFDLQMGTDSQIKSALYPLAILWRSLVVTLTGVVVMPLISLIFGKDLLAPISGVQLFERRG